MQQDIEFPSQGITCRGWLLTPDAGPGPYPTVVMAGGWCYTREIVMPQYAEFFLRAGLAALIFDYRNTGASDGDRRQHLDPWAQIEDYKNAISFAETRPEVDADRIGIWGISYSGGHVLIVGATDPRVKAIVSIVGMMDGWVNQKRIQGERRFRQLLQMIADDRRRRFEGDPEERYIAMSSPDPDKELAAWNYPEVYEVFMHLKETVAPLHEHYSTLESVELVLDYNVFPFLRRIVDIPTEVIIADHDYITLWDLETEAFNAIPTPTKKLFVVPDTAHMTLYSDKSALDLAAEECTDWLGTYLRAEVPVLA
jgi:hypothetical protein